jgi:hypothetical protein
MRWAVEARGGEIGRGAAAAAEVPSAGEGALLREGEGIRELGRLPKGEEVLGDGAELAGCLMRVAAGAGVARELGDWAGLV